MRGSKYNVNMEYNAVLFTCIAVPKGLRQGDWAMAALVLLSAAAGLYVRALLPGTLGQLLAFFTVLAVCLWLLRLRLAHYRYAVDEKYFYAERTEGREPRAVARLPLADIRLERPAGSCKSIYITPNHKKTATALYCCSGEDVTVYYAELSAEFREKLSQKLEEIQK